jgi:hypothetical protein
MARPLWGQGLVPPMGGFSKAAPLGCGFFSMETRRESSSHSQSYYANLSAAKAGYFRALAGN